MKRRRSVGSLLTGAGALWLAGTPAAAAPSFTEELQFGTGSTIAVAWGDVQTDGVADLAIGNYFNEQNYCYFGHGDGTFTEVNKFGLKSTFALAWGDYDNDGDRDVAVGNGTSQQNKLFVNNGGGAINGQNQFGLGSTVALAWADADLDGDLDLAVGNGILGTPEQNYLYVNNGDGTFTQQVQFGTGQTASLTWADFDGDGDPDLAVGNGGFGTVEQNYLYVNNGDGSFTQRLEFGTGDTSVLVWGDADNDGDLDLAVGNWNGGQNYLYRNDAGTFVQFARFGARDPNTMAWGDSDNDGDLDLAVGNGDFGSADQNYLYVNEGGLTFTESAQFGLGSTDGVAWADCDDDGDLDLAVGNEHTTTQNYLYVNNENDATWLRLTLVGHFHDSGTGWSNRDGVGARVLVYEAGFLGDAAHLLGFREIEAHGGFASQNEITAHFGLAGHASADVRILWPGSGGTNLVQDLTGVPVPGRATVHEGATAVGAPAAERPSAGTAWRVAPNPATSGVRVEYLRPVPAGTRLEIVDVSGRVVRTLGTEGTSRGVRALWNGRVEGGEPAAPGVYFARIPGADGPARITVIR